MKKTPGRRCLADQTSLSELEPEGSANDFLNGVALDPVENRIALGLQSLADELLRCNSRLRSNEYFLSQCTMSVQQGHETGRLCIEVDLERDSLRPRLVAADQASTVN
jgi:hypothetical protein